MMALMKIEDSSIIARPSGYEFAHEMARIA